MSVHTNLHSSKKKRFPCGDKEIIFQAFSFAEPSMIIVSVRETGLQFPSVQFTASPGTLNGLFLPGEDGEAASFPVKLASPNR